MKQITLKSFGNDVGQAAAAGAGLAAGSIVKKQFLGFVPETLPAFTKGLVITAAGIVLSASFTDKYLKAAGLGVTMAGVLDVAQTTVGDKLPIPTLSGVGGMRGLANYRPPLVQPSLLSGVIPTPLVQPSLLS